MQTTYKANQQATLTPNETKILFFIKGYYVKKGYPPSYEEIRERFGYKALGSVQQYIEQLANKGYLKAPLGESKKRALEPVDIEASEVARVPLDGFVAAGVLTEAISHREFIDVPVSLLKPGVQYFALKVKGNSMIEDCILDGDTVVIKKQATANNGQIVIALVNNDATIKRYYKKKNKIELHPANPAFDVIIVESTEEFKILGVLASVIRQCD